MDDSAIGLFIFFAILILGGVIALACYCESAKKKNFLRNKIGKLGSLTQYTYDQLVSQIGIPNGIQYVDGGMVCTWQECETSGWSWGITGVYTVTLLFDNCRRCVGISSETYV